MPKGQSGFSLLFLQFSLSCVATKTQCASLSLCSFLVFLSFRFFFFFNWCAVSTQQLSGESSEPTNYCLGNCKPRAPRQTSKTSQRLWPRLSGDEGCGSRQVKCRRGSPPPHFFHHYAFYLMDLTNMNGSWPQGGE